MTTIREIVFWISIIFVAVSSTSSVLEEKHASACNVLVNRTKSVEIPFTKTYERRIWWTMFIYSENVTETIYSPVTYKVSVVEQRCCEGYKNQSGICEPRCSPNCKNGDCVQPDVCKCNHGWRGDLCNETLFCVVRSSSTDRRKIQEVIKNSQNEGESPECDKECHDQLGRKAVNVTQQENAVSCVLPLDCQCSAGEAHSASLKKYISLVAVVGGIALLAVAIYAVKIMRSKRRAKKEMDNVPVQSGIPLDYMVENTIYS